MNKLTKSRLLSFLLAMVMIIGTISPAFAAGLEDPFEPEQRVETELIARDGKLRGRLVVPRNAQLNKSLLIKIRKTLLLMILFLWTILKRVFMALNLKEPM